MTSSTRRLALYYVVLAVLLAGVVVYVLAVADDRQPERAIAGGYDVTSGGTCLDAQFDLRQSGQFVTLSGEDGSIRGKLRVRDGRLEGALECAAGPDAEIDAQAREGALVGSVGNEELRAELTRDPPPAGARKRVPSSVAGEYRVAPRSDCLGTGIELEAHGSGVELLVAGRAAGELEYADGALEGEVECADDEPRIVSGEASDRQITLVLAPAGAEPASEGAPVPGAERVVATKAREFGGTLAALFFAIAVVMLVARLTGALFVRIGQPRVMGEVVAGIALGPTLLGAIAPEAQSALFPSDIIPYIGAAANLGLIFYMFLVGLEIDFGQLKGRIGQTAAISNTGVLLPMALGLLVAVPIYELVGPDNEFIGFALFMGVSMSVTAFPVLARILVERRMLRRPVGALALAAAAIDDVSAWFLIALASAVATAGGSASSVVQTIALTVVFCLAMAFLARPLLARVAAAYEEAGRIPTAWITAIFAGVLFSAYATEIIGIALIFGAFIMGAIMPRHAGLTEDVTHRLEDFVVMLLLPLFFAYTGLRTDVFLLDRLELVLVTLLLLGLAIVCKFGGCMLAARITGLGWRESSVIGALMNTRGLTELIVLNLALDKGVISEALFAMLVIMALFTTFMTGPFLRLLDPENRFGAPVEEQFEAARRESLADSPIPVPERSMLLAPQTDAALGQMLALAEPLARSEPPRELILARVVRPPRGAAVRGGLQTEDRMLAEAQAEVVRARLGLLERRVAARAVAFTSVDPGRDLARLSENEAVDLILIDGRRPLVGKGVPGGEVGAVLERAPCDVAVLVAREAEVLAPGPEAPVVVPFGGDEHDWAALELGAWIAAATDAPLKLLGAAGQTDERGDASRLLGNASLLVQQFVGIAAEPVTVESGSAALLTTAGGAGLLVIGLSDRWREEGLGEIRSEIARAAPAPVLFVRRGTRAGALAPRDDVTRFTWSSPAIGPSFGP